MLNMPRKVFGRITRDGARLDQILAPAEEKIPVSVCLWQGNVEETTAA